MTHQLMTEDADIIEFNNNQHARIKIRPMYYELGFSTSKHIYGRRMVLDQLKIAIEQLPKEYAFLIWDVYRPRSVQSTLFDWMRGEVRKKFPAYSDQQNIEETRKYIAMPSKVGDDYCPPHLSGGAIDLTLFDSANNQAFDMGTPFDDCSERAHSNYYDNRSHLSEAETHIKERRLLLKAAMENAGFTSYQYEWWHFDIGNILWSRNKNQPPLFGPLFGDEEWPT